MTILNTTFIVPCDLKRVFVDWLAEEYVTPALAEGGFVEPRLARVMGGSDPDTMSLALEMKCESLRTAKHWESDRGAHLMGQMIAKFEKKVMFFTTFLQEEQL